MGSSTYQNPTININSNTGSVTDSYKNVWNNCEISMSDEKRQILEWLSPLAPRERHQAVREGRLDGVGDWLLRTSEFKEWHTSEDQAVNPVLFRYGDPGVGKTYLSSLVIDTLCDAIDGDNVAVACVYCDFHTRETQFATGVLAVLLKQLVAGMGPIPRKIKEAFERAKREADGQALRLPEVRSMLVKSLKYLRRGFICIDALDEFPTKNRPELWDSLQHIVRECPNTRLFVTGRPHIREEVREYFPGCPDLSPIKPTKEGIIGYLTMRLKKDSVHNAMDTGLEADILRIITERTSGGFLLVSLIMDAILENATIHRRRQTLERMTNDFGLDDVYRETLSRIREPKGRKAKLGMEALMWILRAERPLKAEELCHALAVEVGTADLNADNVPSIGTLLSSTLGLVTVDEQTSAVRLVHFTLQEYLVKRPYLFTTPHSMMAEICLTYLNFRFVCELATTLDTIPSTMPFLHYASCYWGFHARKQMTESAKRLALPVLRRDANHISAFILLCEKSSGFLSLGDRGNGIRPNLGGFTGLHCITYMDVPEIAIAMLNRKIWDLNGRDSNGATPLIWAAKYGNYRLAKLLLEQEGVSPTLSDKRGRTSLTHAARVGNDGLVKLLLQRRGVDPDSLDKDGRAPLSYAAGSGHEGVVELLLKQGNVNPDSSTQYGRTPLSYAAGSGHEGVVKLLLRRRDVSPDSSNKCGQTPLSYAAESGHKGVVKLLLDRVDVNPDSPTKYGQTPLSCAARPGHEPVVRLLLERRDVNPNSLDIFGSTPLLYAAGFRHESVVKLLLERADIDPNSSAKHGWTPLSRAARSGYEGVVKLLLAREDCNPGSLDGGGRTPLSYAAEYGHVGVVKLLSESRTFSHETSQNSSVTQQISRSATSARGVVELGAVSPERIIPDTGPEIIEAAPLSRLDGSPSDQLEVPPSAPCLALTHKSDTTPHHATPKPPGPLKRRSAIRRLLCFS